MSDNYPNDLLYTEDHEWARVEDKLVTVGVTQFAVEQLGDVTQVELPREGEQLKQGEAFGTVESVKAVSEIYSPASGTVTDINSELTNTPEKINSDPHGSWIVKVKLKDPSEIKGLLSAEDYEKFVAEEQGH
jgi:glycine cleavage system H protein